MDRVALLFVYGSLKRGSALHHELEALQASFLGLAKIQGELFHIKGKSWPGAFLTASETYVQSEIYKMMKPAEALKRLTQSKTASTACSRESLCMPGRGIAR